ncbi:MurR/RpiR family transcriptional regulator [Bacillus sp. SG-1]|uniref:MurR/RpiR family transcriptional regulator n=1 Tax=Bacillus sp. SG-1 TaxID=161544 RepID=UPI00015454A1|nr:MurR/RpiR family transcriptional regulator [Bacillus sp. SG-1]EDL64376.1 transcriptional regulator (RpiR family) protein [Bacillus sp. SG-1]
MEKNHQHCLASIRSHYSQFSDTEKKIANYILNNPTDIIHSTINGLADELGVADSTVFRFCKRIGFKGYQSMKIALAAEIVTPMRDIHENVDENDTPQTIASKVFRSNMKTIEDTLMVLKEKQFQETADAMLTADNIEFFGSGGSGIVAMDAYHKFIRTGLRVHASTDSHIQLMTASQMTKKDCAVLISHSGSTKDILQVMKVLKESGAKTIAITNFAKSPLSEKADISLYTVSEETDYRSEALSSRIAQLSIFDALYVSIMLKRDQDGQDALKKMRNAISVKRL